MNIVVIGSGTVGAAICIQLQKEGHDITVVDKDYNAITELSNICDVYGIVGNGADISSLKKAGADKADLLIAVTSGDEVNILCCSAARKLGTKHTIARVRNPEYSGFLDLMKNDMNLSLTINPELSAAKEIYRILRFPSATKIDTLCKGKVELAEFTVTKDSMLSGKTLNELRTQINIKFLVCCVLRNGDVHIPSGNFVLNEGDVIGVTAPDQELELFFKAIGAYKQPIKDVLIAGGGRTTYYLEELMKDSKIRSAVIEKDKLLCRDIAEQYDCTVICEDGTNQELLLEEGLGKADAFLALTDVDEENAIMSMYAKTLNTPKVVTMIRTLPFIEFFKGAGLESIVSPKSSTSTSILKYVRALANITDSEIESLHRMMDGKMEAVEFKVKEDIPGLTGISLKALKRREGALVACIMRGEDIIIPSGDDKISVGDTVIVITTGGQMKSIKDIL